MFRAISDFVKGLLPHKADDVLMRRFQQLRNRSGLEDNCGIDVLTQVRSQFDHSPVVGKTLSPKEMDRLDMLLSSCGHNGSSAVSADSGKALAGARP